MSSKFLTVLPLAVLLTGCAGISTRSTPLEVWPDMDRQHKFRAQSANPNFADGRTQHLPPDGTVAVGLLKEDESFYQGHTGGMYVGRNPLTLDKATLSSVRRSTTPIAPPATIAPARSRRRLEEAADLRAGQPSRRPASAPTPTASSSTSSPTGAAP